MTAPEEAERGPGDPVRSTSSSAAAMNADQRDFFGSVRRSRGTMWCEAAARRPVLG